MGNSLCHNEEYVENENYNLHRRQNRNVTLQMSYAPNTPIIIHTRRIATLQFNESNDIILALFVGGEQTHRYDFIYVYFKNFIFSPK
ncbi:hypothetical protein pb186bvf_016211 [Paramecium bursaria]